MFFVSLLLNQVLAWTRLQSGTTSLRAILYMDEIFGFFPPVANPPSKQPLLTLLKQARAFGVGVLLATQNPVDLDYKGLSNTGTWFIGRLQTERDKARVIEGLEGVAASQGAKFDRGAMEQTMAGLGSRIFLMNNVHEDAPVVMETRWAMSYLRGPLTRNQIKVLMDPVKAAMPKPAVPAYAAPAPTTTAAPQATTAAGSPQAAPKSSRPVLPPDVQQLFVPARGGQSVGSNLFYKPVLLGSASVNFSDTKTGIDTRQDIFAYTEITEEVIPVNWENAKDADFNVSDLEKAPGEPSQFGQLAPIASKSKSYNNWSKEFSTYLYGSRKFELLKSPTYKQFSKPGEAERDFRVRLSQVAREQRDDLTEKLRQKYATKMASLEEQARKAQQAVDREANQQKQQQMSTVISVGATLLSAFVGRKISTGTIGRASTAARSAGRIMKEKEDVDRAKETLASHKQRLADLEQEFKTEMDDLSGKLDPMNEALDKITIRPAKKDIIVRLVSLTWLPYWQSQDGRITPAWQ